MQALDAHRGRVAQRAVGRRTSKALMVLAAGLLFATGAVPEKAEGADWGFGSSMPAEAVATGSAVVAGQQVRYSLRKATTLEFPRMVDSSSPSYWRDGQLVVFNSAFYPTRSTGTSLVQLGAPQEIVTLQRFRAGGWWFESIWPDPESGTLYGWYHLEPDDLPCLTAPFIGAVISHDGGTSWIDLGPVVDTAEPVDCGYDNGFFVGGHGDVSVILDQEGRYFYFVYSNYSGAPEEQGVAVARSAFEDRGRPGTAFKYYKGSWDEPGLGGKADAIFPSSTGWAGPFVEAFWGPSVHWNEHLRLYVSLLNHTAGTNWEQEGIYLSFSRDLVTWTEPQKVLEAVDWYPQVMGLEPGGTDRLGGKTVRLYVGGRSEHVLEFER